MITLSEIFWYRETPLYKKYLLTIQSESVPLEQRWDIFCEAPEDWKFRARGIPDFSVISEEEIREILLNEWEFYKGSTISTKHLSNLLHLNEQDTETLKREILEKNLNSFMLI